MIHKILDSLDISQVSSTDLSQAQTQLWKYLIPHISYLPENERDMVSLAFEQMVISHNHQRRKSGEFYIIHPVCATILLSQLKLDYRTLCACLLHDVPEDTTTTFADLLQHFDHETVFLIEGVTKFSSVKYQGEDRYAENLRKMFVAMSTDLRVIFIKLADRLHNLMTLHHLPQSKRYRIALESLEIYAPIAERLGISLFQNAIEEEAFAYVHPDIYDEFTRNTQLEINRRHNQMTSIVELTKQALEKHGIPVEVVYGRAKKYYSIYRKIQDREKQLDELYDLIAVRIITPSIESCYLALTVIEQSFHTIANRYKDYIATPKPNGYQSLHCNATLTHEQLKEIDQVVSIPFEFQIRTKDMHEYAEYGVAAHFAYKGMQKKTKITEFLRGENLKWVKELVELGNTIHDNNDYVRKVKLDLFADRIFVLTPKNDVIDLPTGATVLDFAYRIHQDIGHTASIARVNNKTVKLSTTLQSGDEVEIITDKKQKPRPDWLNNVITRHARHSIRTYLKHNL